MKRVLVAALAVSTISLAACGGGGGNSAPVMQPPVVATTQPQQKATAVQSVSFRIPFSVTLSGGPKSSPSSTKRSPKYISPDTSILTFVIDGTVLPNISVTPVAPGTDTPQTGSVSFANGQSLTYTTTAVTDANGSSYYQVTANMDLVAGARTLGVLLRAADGFVLSEAQGSYLLSGGTNPAATMVLKPVADSAFMCDWPNCDGNLGTMNADGTYTIVAFASDHEGDTIVQAAAPPASGTAFANGPISIVEPDGLGVVTITNGGPFTDAGSDENLHNGYAASVPGGWYAGHAFTMKCNTTGSTTVAVKLAANSPAAGAVNGFDYTALIDTSKDPVNAGNGTPFPVTQTSVWTTPGQIIGTVPTFQDFGNSLHVNCDASMNLTLS